MKFKYKILILLLFISINFQLKAFTRIDTTKSTMNDIFFFVEESPSYPGGNDRLKNYFIKNLEYPQIAKSKEIEGQVLVRFEIKKDGTIGEIIISKSAHPILDSEAIKVIKNMPKWIPGFYDEKPVNSWYTIPVSFYLNNKNK